MATAVFSTIGGQIGSSIGSTYGGVIGAQIGSTLGQAAGYYVGGQVDNALFGKTHTLPDVIGPRLSELKTQVSTYGKVIPILYGRNRLAGNVIWCPGLIEEEVSSTVRQGGGKGGGGSSVQQTSTTYNYYATLAIAICEGRITSIDKVWADAELLTDEFLQEATGYYEVHLGGEAQVASPIIEEIEGVGNVPAYRGLSYVVIKRFPLAKYGNRIPNFTFEVHRKEQIEPTVESKIKDIIMIPGSGETVYSPTIQKKISWNDLGPSVGASGGGIFGGITGRIIVELPDTVTTNMHNYKNQANVLQSLDDLARDCPNIERVGVVVMWFATSKNPATAQCIPKVEYNAVDDINLPAIERTYSETTPDAWAVAGYTRETAQRVLIFDDGSLTYGGTPSDKEVVDLCVELKSRGYEVMLYPFLAVDTIADSFEDDKPWRGRITPTSVADVTAFFNGTNKYKAFIEHYATLTVDGVALKDNIDTFVIGSELKGLTTYSNTAGNYPAVTRLKELAATVKTAVGAGVSVVYAADWSEYHSVDGWFHLDPLWSDSNIDKVAIDAYFPLTDDLPQASIDYQAIYDGWTSGEGYDYYYTDPVARTGLTNYSGLTYAWKAMYNWWNTTHTNPDASVTAWTSQMKPLILTEFGFPSVDGCSNQPNVFYDPSSVESYFPRASRGRVDFFAQRLAIEASIDFFQDQNALNGDFLPETYLWTWDARPYPYFPDRRDIWADYQLWRTGHWVTGKFGGSNLGAIVADFLDRLGFSASDYDVTELTDFVEGFVISSDTSIRQALEQLQQVYFFDMVESDGVLKFRKRSRASVYTIPEEELVKTGTGDGQTAVSFTRVQELELPRKVNISYYKRDINYGINAQIAQRQTGNAVNVETINTPVVLSDESARKIAETHLYSRWENRTVYNFTLPPDYIDIEPTDVVTLTVNNVSHTVRILAQKIKSYGIQECTAISDSPSAYDFYIEPGVGELITQDVKVIPDIVSYFYDLPTLTTDTWNETYLRVGVIGVTGDWRGDVIYRSDDGGEAGGNNWSVIGGTGEQAIPGRALTLLADAGVETWDEINTVDIAISRGTLSSTTELAVLNGANAILIGDELVQFKTATMLNSNPRQWRLSGLLRGRQGTEWATSTHAIGDGVLFINTSLSRITLPVGLLNQSRYYKVVTVGSSLALTDETTFTHTGKSLKPWAVTDLEHSSTEEDGGMVFTWKRRTRLGGELTDNSDVPVSEENEQYEIDVLDGVTVARTLTSNEQTVTYTQDQQIEDFTTVPTSFSIKVYQMSAIVGRGYVTTLSVTASGSTEFSSGFDPAFS